MEGPVLIGRILGAHGIRGEVKLTSFAAIPADIGRYKPLTLRDGRAIVIARLKPAKDGFIAALQGVADRNAAESFRGQDVFVERSLLPSLKDGEFYLSDLTGKPVNDGTATLGTAAGIQNFGAGDLIELDNGLLIPVAFVTSVGDAVAVTLPDGFLDESDQDHPPPPTGEVSSRHAMTEGVVSGSPPPGRKTRATLPAKGEGQGTHNAFSRHHPDALPRDVSGTARPFAGGPRLA